MKKIILIIVGIIVLVIIGLIVVPLIVDINTYKPKAEAVLSDALGMEVKIQGDMHIVLLPDFSVSLKDVTIRGKDTDFCIVKKAKVDLELSSLLRNEINRLEIDLVEPAFNIVKDKDGLFNFEKPGKPPSPSSINLPHIEKFSISKGDVIYLDKKNEDKLTASGINLALADVSFNESAGKTLMQTISLDGTVKADYMKSEEYEISNIDLQVKARNGVFELRSISTSDLRSKKDDRINIDLTGKIPVFKIQYAESGIPAEEMLRRLSQEENIKGKIDLSINLSMKGQSLPEIKKTLTGDISVTGKDLIFHGIDIDDVITKFERSQHLNLLDVGSTFFLGPFGPAITKGSEFAQVYSALQKEKDSEIQQLICAWNLKNGVAEAKDVALSTKKHRVAMVGKMDLVSKQFIDVTLAVLDSKGCAVVSQEMHGSFSNPEIETMNTIQALVGPVMGVLDDTTNVFLRRKCKVIYKGSLEHPEVKKRGLLKRP